MEHIRMRQPWAGLGSPHHPNFMGLGSGPKAKQRLMDSRKSGLHSYFVKRVGCMERMELGKEREKGKEG